MENKVYLKKTIILNLIIFLGLFNLFLIINTLEYHTYIKNYNLKVNSIYLSIKEKYPHISNLEIMEIIKSNKTDKDMLQEFGYDINNESIIKDNRKCFIIYIFIEGILFISLCILINYLYLKYNKKKDENINGIINLINEINNKNYKLNIEELNEDELSILKNEIYKTALTLRENASNSLKDKLNLKKSLEDISHQIRTPLTSIIINIDNLMDNPNLDNKQKSIFLHKIKREIYNIKTLVDTLLKLSRFDVNEVTFIKKDVKLKKLVNDAINNVLILADLKNIKIEIIDNKNDIINCDLKWEVEAISNILKNGIEHAYPDSNIKIIYDSNNVYSKIEIINKGETINKKVLKHIFERFYKGENFSKDSFGIGLSLAKSIVEKDNGKIFVESSNNETKFMIKYYK